MRRLLCIGFLLWGCGAPPPDAGKKAPEKKAISYFHVDPATAGKVSGVIRLAGKAPAMKRISMDSDEDCQKLHPKPVFEEKVLVGKGGGLANVFVYVKEGLEGKTFEPAPQAVVMEQKGCQFLPRIVTLRVGQTLTVKNSDPVSHNIHPMPKNNRDWNQQQPPQAADLLRRFGYPEVMIPVKCNIHGWMRSYISVLDHPFFAVSGSDGEFSIAGLPPGKYVLAAWHEAFGEKTVTVNVADGGVAKADIVFGAAPKS